MNQTEHFKRRK